MRVIAFIVLIVLLSAVGIFVFQNNQIVRLEYLDWSIACPIAMLVGLVYLMGMFSGWTVLGVFRRSLRRVSVPTHY